MSGPPTVVNQQLIIFISSLCLVGVILTVVTICFVVRAMRRLADRAELLRSADITMEGCKRREEMQALRLDLVSYVDQLNAALDRHEQSHDPMERQL